MITLPNGCRCSEPKVTPSNWKAQTPKSLTNWIIHYRFYDPTFDKPAQIKIRSGINLVKDPAERRAMAKSLIEDELHKLRELGYNPITNTFITPLECEYEIDPETPFIAALWKALDKLPVVKDTRKDMKSVVNGVKKAALQLRFDQLPINKISRRHIKMILDRCSKNNARWSARRYNMYRSYLLMIFKELVELEAVTANPIRDISKMKEIKRLRPVLSDAQRVKIDEHLAKVDVRFQAFVHLFFHSGGRLKELVQVQAKSVDHVKQTYKAVVRKGTAVKEVERTIKDVALPYWKVFLEGTTSEDYLFGIDFLPAKKHMISDTITRRWQRLVKNPKTGLGINIDLYSLKHLNTSETVDQIGDKGAAGQNAHTSTQMVATVYDVRRVDREHEQRKKVNNKFA